MATPRKNRNSKQKKFIKQWVIEKHGQQCWICNTALPYHKITMDHVDSLNLGGPDRKENMKPACQPCNTERGAAVQRLLDPGCYKRIAVKKLHGMLHRMKFVDSQLEQILRRAA